MADVGSMQERANSFGSAAQAYAAARPSYPREAARWLVAARAERVLDLGAGTGKFTSVLVDVGYDVVAVEPSPDMLAELTALLPRVEAHVGTAEAIPLPDASVDAVTVAQAWHWVDPAVAAGEIARVLRPRGTLGLTWNNFDTSADWVRRLDELMGNTHGLVGDGPDPVVGEPFGPLDYWRTTWTQPIQPARLLDLVRSVSAFITKSPDGQAEAIAAITELLATHPDTAGKDELELPYITECFRARLG